jgi:hypothetical protein
VFRRLLGEIEGDAVPQGARFRAFAEALDVRGEPVAWSFDWANARADARPVDVKLPAWSTEFDRLRVHLTTPPPGLVAVDARLAVLPAPHQRFERGRRTSSLAERTTLEFASPHALGNDSLVRMQLAYDDPNDTAEVRMRRQIDSDFTVSLSSMLLPRLHGARAFVKARRVHVTWQASGAAPNADAHVVQIAWPETRTNMWTLLAPPTATAVVFPQLPPDLDRAPPNARTMKVGVALVDTSELDGYADVRRKGPHELFELPEDEPTFSAKASMTGTVTF